jgi:hypothetical protein
MMVGSIQAEAAREKPGCVNIMMAWHFSKGATPRGRTRQENRDAKKKEQALGESQLFFCA